MNILIKKSHIAIAALTALIVSACGVGNDVAGIGGSGYISTGTITSFGSVFVNGVEFETTASTFEIEDDVSLTQTDLRIGMVVEVTGSINADGMTGTATHIKYGDDLEGPVTSINVIDLHTIQLSIFGNAVMVSEVSTTFENTTFAEIVVGNVLEVSGFYDQNNVLQASYIEFKSASSNTASVFEVKGMISDLNANDFLIQGIAVNADTAVLDGLPDNGLQNGLLVEVKGVLVNNIIVATSIDSEDSFSEGGTVEIEGIITRYVDDSDFDVNEQRVDASSASLSPAGLVLEEGVKVEAEGQLVNGVFIASAVEAREGSASVSAKISEVFLATDSFTVEVLTDQLVTVKLTTATSVKDEMSTDDELKLSVFLENLSAGDFVVVKGIESASDTITATEVKRESELKATELQGIVTDESINDFTVLGVVFPVVAETTYDDAVDLAGFQQLTELGVTVISISDNLSTDGIADEVGIED